MYAISTASYPSLLDRYSISNSSQFPSSLALEDFEARDHSFPLVEQPSLLQMVESGGCPPPMNITSQFPVNNILPQTSIVNSGSNYNSNCYSFAGQSGKQLQPMQQTEGNSAGVQNY
uniref:Uncharacterized protein n=1 Tax=Solanum lycopersicum TaxID=4081 RepID=A0A3Q7EGJ7_SOLLC